MQEEIFLPIPDTDNSYFISNKGRVLSISKTHHAYCKPHILSCSRNRSTGYLKMDIRMKGRKRKTYYIHRLVAMLFVPNSNPSLYTYVNHIDENKLNNDASNLEWCTCSINMTKFWQGKRRDGKTHKAIYD